MTETPHMKRPCPECPWRVDSTPNQFAPDRFEALRGTSGRTGGEARFGSPFFACHKSTEGKDAICAGWLAVEGYNNLGARYLGITGKLPAAAFQPAEDWPELYGSYDEMAANKGSIDA